MINFTVGPVQSSEAVRKIGAENTPYFRTPEFSKIMLENEALMKKFTKAEENARVVFITGSGTASMEAVVMNTLSSKDKALVVNGGSFGTRFVKLCEIHGIPYSEIKLSPGEALTEEKLQPYDDKDYTAFLVNIHETSTGVLYDAELISDFCKRNHLFWIVDAISSFLADPFDMKKWNVDVMITGSQKALAVPPGISIIVLGEQALKRIDNIECKCMYFDLKDALKNGERGQTPFTPAVTTLLQIHERLLEIDKIGVEHENERVAKLAENFRERIKDLPFRMFSQSPSNAVTALETETASAKDIFTILKNEYHIWICPNGGELAEKVFRIGHIGDLTVKDNEKLVDALEDLKKRNII